MSDRKTHFELTEHEKRQVEKAKWLRVLSPDPQPQQEMDMSMSTADLQQQAHLDRRIAAGDLPGWYLEAEKEAAEFALISDLDTFSDWLCGSAAEQPTEWQLESFARWHRASPDEALAAVSVDVLMAASLHISLTQDTRIAALNELLRRYLGEAE